jgi:hypothetical protein
MGRLSSKNPLRGRGRPRNPITSARRIDEESHRRPAYLGQVGYCERPLLLLRLRDKEEGSRNVGRRGGNIRSGYKWKLE